MSAPSYASVPWVGADNTDVGSAVVEGSGDLWGDVLAWGSPVASVADGGAPLQTSVVLGNVDGGGAVLQGTHDASAEAASTAAGDMLPWYAVPGTSLLQTVGTEKYAALPPYAPYSAATINDRVPDTYTCALLKAVAAALPAGGTSVPADLAALVAAYNTGNGASIAAVQTSFSYDITRGGGYAGRIEIPECGLNSTLSTVAVEPYEGRRIDQWDRRMGGKPLISYGNGVPLNSGAFSTIFGTSDIWFCWYFPGYLPLSNQTNFNHAFSPSTGGGESESSVDLACWGLQAWGYGINGVDAFTSVAPRDGMAYAWTPSASASLLQPTAFPGPYAGFEGNINADVAQGPAVTQMLHFYVNAEGQVCASTAAGAVAALTINPQWFWLGDDTWAGTMVAGVFAQAPTASYLGSMNEYYNHSQGSAPPVMCNGRNVPFTERYTITPSPIPSTAPQSGNTSGFVNSTSETLPGTTTYGTPALENSVNYTSQPYNLDGVITSYNCGNGSASVPGYNNAGNIYNLTTNTSGWGVPPYNESVQNPTTATRLAYRHVPRQRTCRSGFWWDFDYSKMSAQQSFTSFDRRGVSEFGAIGTVPFRTAETLFAPSAPYRLPGPAPGYGTFNIQCRPACPVGYAWRWIPQTDTQMLSFALGTPDENNVVASFYGWFAFVGRTATQPIPLWWTSSKNDSQPYAEVAAQITTVTTTAPFGALAPTAPWPSANNAGVQTMALSWSWDLTQITSSAHVMAEDGINLVTDDIWWDAYDANGVPNGEPGDPWSLDAHRTVNSMSVGNACYWSQYTPFAQYAKSAYYAAASALSATDAALASEEAAASALSPTTASWQSVEGQIASGQAWQASEEDAAFIAAADLGGIDQKVPAIAFGRANTYGSWRLSQAFRATYLAASVVSQFYAVSSGASAAPTDPSDPVFKLVQFDSVRQQGACLLTCENAAGQGGNAYTSSEVYAGLGFAPPPALWTPITQPAGGSTNGTTENGVLHSNSNYWSGNAKWGLNLPSTQIAAGNYLPCNATAAGGVSYTGSGNDPGAPDPYLVGAGLNWFAGYPGKITNAKLAQWRLGAANCRPQHNGVAAALAALPTDLTEVCGVPPTDPSLSKISNDYATKDTAASVAVYDKYALTTTGDQPWAPIMNLYSWGAYTLPSAFAYPDGYIAAEEGLMWGHACAVTPAAAACPTPFIGIGGSTLCMKPALCQAGYSWIPETRTCAQDCNTAFYDDDVARAYPLTGPPSTLHVYEEEAAYTASGSVEASEANYNSQFNRADPTGVYVGPAFLDMGEHRPFCLLPSTRTVCPSGFVLGSAVLHAPGDPPSAVCFKPTQAPTAQALANAQTNSARAYPNVTSPDTGKVGSKTSQINTMLKVQRALLIACVGIVVLVLVGMVFYVRNQLITPLLRARGVLAAARAAAAADVVPAVTAGVSTLLGALTSSSDSSSSSGNVTPATAQTPVTRPPGAAPPPPVATPVPLAPPSAPSTPSAPSVSTTRAAGGTHAPAPVTLLGTHAVPSAATSARPYVVDTHAGGGGLVSRLEHTLVSAPQHVVSEDPSAVSGGGVAVPRPQPHHHPLHAVLARAQAAQAARRQQQQHMYAPPIATPAAAAAAAAPSTLADVLASGAQLGSLATDLERAFHQK